MDQLSLEWVIIEKGCLKITISRGVRWMQQKGTTTLLSQKSQNNYLTWSEMDVRTVETIVAHDGSLKITISRGVRWIIMNILF